MDENIIDNQQQEQQVVAQKQSYKMIALRGVVVFPGQSIHFDLGRDKSLTALNKAIEAGEEIFLVAQKHSVNTNPAPKDIYRVGVLAKVKQVLKLQHNDTVRVLVGGLSRMEIDNYVSISPYFEVTLKPFEEKPDNPEYLAAVKRLLDKQFVQFKKLENKVPAEVMATLNTSDTDKLIYTIATNVYTSEADRQALLQMDSVSAQLEDIYSRLSTECEVMSLERKISNKVRSNMDKSQREYYLREQMKVIREELGDNEDELEEYRKRAKKKKLPDYVMKKVEKELIRMDKMSPTSPEAGVSRTYIEWILDLPWSEFSDENNDLIKAREILDEEHYGLDKVKDRIIEYLAVHHLTRKLKSPILCFVGPPGVGKTSIVSSIARASGRKLVSMSLGGVRDEAEIRGHRRTYIGALPGRIVSGMKQAESVNPVFLLDEIDKMSSDFRGDPASAMLEVLDPNQNAKFKDHYLEMEYDLSNVMFVTTANTLDTIAPPLLDRMEVIELSGYTYEEKLQIAKRYLVPKQLESNGLKEMDITISDDILMSIISSYTRESGVRNLEREIATVARKLAVRKVNGEIDHTAKVTDADITEFLGAVKFKDEQERHEDEVGLARGLAWTRVGGVTLDIEVAVIPDGKGEIKLTGSLGDVMKESCLTALSLVRRHAEDYDIPNDMFTKYDIHIHLPEGATPKDGPSAGITMATAILSALSGRKVRSDVAMTGEVTLRGKVLAIGGLKEKSLAAFRVGVKRLIVPKENFKDLSEIPSEVKDNLEILFVDKIEEVFDYALTTKGQKPKLATAETVS